MTREEFIPATKPRVRFWKSKDGRAYAWYVYALPQGQSDDWQNFVQVNDFDFESDAKQLVESINENGGFTRHYVR
jgi:hypothetical protein